MGIKKSSMAKILKKHFFRLCLREIVNVLILLSIRAHRDHNPKAAPRLGALSARTLKAVDM